MYIIFLFIQLFVFPCFSYTAKDSLVQLLKTELTNTNRIDVLNELAWVLRMIQSDSAKRYAQEGLLLSQSIDDQRREATSLNRLGEISRLLNQYDRAARYFENALNLERLTDHKFGIARAQSMLCTIYRDQGLYDKAIEFGQESLILFLQMDLKPSAARSFQRLSTIYLQIGLLDSALKQLEQKLVLHEDLQDSSMMANTYWSMGNVYYELGIPEKALEYYLTSKDIWIELSREDKAIGLLTNLANVYMELGQFPKAISAHKASIAFFENIGEPDLAADNYANLGVIAQINGDLTQAKYLLREAIRRKEHANIKRDIDVAWYNQGLVYKKLNELDSALFFLSKVISTSESESVLMDSYWALSEIYYSKKDYDKANDYRQLYGQLKDVLDQSLKEGVRMKDRMEQVKQAQILLKKDNQLKDAELRRRDQQLYTLLITIILFIVLFFFAFLFYRSRKNSVIYEQKVDDLIKAQEIKKLGAELEGRDEERKRIAQELHDRLGGMLSMVKLHYKTVEEQIEDLKDQNKFQYEKANQLLDEACDEVRKISHEMVSGVLYKFGLIQALQSLAESVTETGKLMVEFIPTGINQSFGEEQEMHLYAIVQELLSNVLKHAKATEVTIQLIQKGTSLRLEIADNGNGFDVEKISSHGIGLKNVEARVDNLDGELYIESNQSGTIVNIEMTVKEDMS